MNFEIFQDEWITTSWDDEYSNPIIFPSTLRQTRSTPKFDEELDYFSLINSNQAVETAPENQEQESNPLKIKLSIDKSFRKKSHKTLKSTKVQKQTGKVLKEFFNQVQHQDPLQQLQACQKVKSLIGNLETFLNQIKQKMISQLQNQEQIN